MKVTDPEMRAHLHGQRSLLFVAQKTMALVHAGAVQNNLGSIEAITEIEDRLFELMDRIVEKLAVSP